MIKSEKEKWMKVDITKIDNFRLGGPTGPILLFRQKKSAEFVLALAKEATTDGRISTDRGEILVAIEEFKCPKFRQQLTDNLDRGQLIGVILAQ